ncbi:MAG: hypothetical protein EHM78_15485 [Myxococcaceae bacterium]|nr:MAG: hypothetical protein EHM78_15485 [Myxococcaceae bacterium]
MRSTLVWWISALSVGLAGAAPAEKDAWTLTKVQGGGCRLDSEKGSLSDGYQKTTSQVRVTPTEVRVLSESTFDDSKGDLSIQVDKQEAVKADALDGAKAVVFKGPAAAMLIAQFKAGLKANVTLRFWPTWPETGTHSVVVSLIGFTKAWDEMQATCR